MRALSKLFLLKERRERIISHLLNIRFIHNAAGVFIERVLLPLLIAAMVAVVELVSCAPSFFFFVCFFHLAPSLQASFLKSKMFDVTMHSACLRRCSGEKFYSHVLVLFIFFAFNVLLSVSVCCFSPH